MMNKTLFLVFHLLLASMALGLSQGISQPVNDEDRKEASDEFWEHRRMWKANMHGGSFLVPLGRITAVSRHEYILDATYIVDEVTVDTVGQALARFYFIEPISERFSEPKALGLNKRALGMVGDGVEKSGTNAHHMVSKTYPATTHAKSIEFRMSSKAELSMLHSSVTKAWLQRKGGRIFTVAR